MTKPITVIEAVDWAVYHEQQHVTDEYHVMKGHIVGFVVYEDDERIALAPQLFDNGTTRNTLSVPKVCIKNRYDLNYELHPK